MIKKIISFITLVAMLSMTFTLSFADSNAYESSGSPVKIITDNSHVRIAESQNGNTVTRAIYNKKLNQMDIQVINAFTKKVLKDAQIRTSSNAVTATVDGEMLMSASASRNTYTERTIMNYEYQIDFDRDKWTLWKPKGSSLTSQSSKTVYEKSSSRSNLNNLKDWVDEIDSTEKQLAIYAGGSGIAWIAAIIISAISLGTGASVGLAAAGVTGKTLLVSVDLEKACKKADYYYGRCK